MKKIITILIFYNFIQIFSQVNPTISTNLPAIIPPSPTVSSLMKFQEIPVNNYTGIPDISIPLTQLSTHSNNIPVDIFIKYHPANVKAENTAGEVGLGWTVFAGGTISRVVRGLPDEELVMASTHTSGKVGIYHNNIQNHKNIYYQFVQDPLSYELNNPEISNEYYWETVENGKYDTEHDLWQFNFMGNSGSFFIKKEDNLLKIEPLDDYRIKIESQYATINNQEFTPTGFTVYDDKGYKYVFDVFETTQRSVDIENLTMIMSDYVTNSSHSNDHSFRSSFHLTKVIDPNNKTVFDIEYDERVLIESNLQKNLTINDYGNNTDPLKYSNCWSEMGPLQTKTVSNSIINVKKIKYINIPQQAKIEFMYSIGRSDTNVNPGSTFLREIKLVDSFNKLIYKYVFDYDYNSITYNRMFLKSITKTYSGNSNSEKHEFFYKRNIPTGLPANIGKDYWGYFNAFSFENCSSQDITFMREPSPSVSTLDLLQKIKYPTGGSSIFKFETNEYSFVGDEPITDFSSNPNITFLGIDNYNFVYNNNNYQLIPMHNKDRKVVIYTNIVLPNDPNTWTRNIFLSKITNGNITPVGTIYCVEPNGNCCFEFILEKNVQYAFKRNNFDTTYHDTDNLSIHYYEINNNNKFLYGGGNRISKIGYFTNDIPQDYYDSPNVIIPGIQKQYSYKMPEDSTKSSGSLVFGKPKFEEYRFVKQNGTICAKLPYSSCLSYSGISSYLSKNITSNQEIVSTQGADVGYKYVKEEQIGLGSKEQFFTSPIDYPEQELITYTKPYLPAKNIDYKRGLLLKERVNDNFGRVLNETSNTYDFINYEKLYGYRFNKPDAISFQGRLENHTYSAFKTWKESSQLFVTSSSGPGCSGNSSFNSFSQTNLGIPKDDIDYYPLIQAFGWSRLSLKQTKNYSYENGNQRVLEQNESFEYNPINKNISQHILTTSDGDQIKTKYFYHDGNSVFSQNRISEIEKIESYKNGKLLDTKKINYNSNWQDNVAILPQEIQNSFGSEVLQTEVTYDRYDSKGNLQQYTTKDGISTAIVWGYNSTQPIAKVE
ncbi:hypothetical protein N0B16_14100, partial [Chryseobacterium sp. GMJ5]